MGLERGGRWRTLGIAALVLGGCDLGGKADRQAGSVQSSDSPRSQTVAAYCERFARALSGRHGIEYRAGTARTEKQSDAMTWISNWFQPPDARFTSGYDCRFQATNARGRVQEVSAVLLLTGTVEFAEYTQWPELQAVPIEYVVDEAGGRDGFGVFKYLSIRP